MASHVKGRVVLLPLLLPNWTGQGGTGRYGRGVGMAVWPENMALTAWASTGWDGRR
jgi:hypothetical protein